MTDRPAPSKLGLYARSAVSVLIVIMAWEIAARMQFVSALFLPPFSAVMLQLWSTIADGTLFTDLGVSLGRTFGGLAIAAVGGILLGVAMARVRALDWLLDPLVALAFPAPKIAFLPVFILWFGIDHLSKILLVAFTCVFPVMIGAYSAARSVNRVLIWSAWSLGTGRTALLTHVILPACGPRIFATLRVAVPVALVTTFTAEMVAGGGGMGATLMYSQRFFESSTVFAYIVVMLTVGLAIDAAMQEVQSRVPATANVP
ncbi:ABC transporter permease [Rhodoplanes sp. Z2-YC6860]|uniref:ABC transporter permease n=1 Tax=Rhodoplanes sp. Z2-YC6860 TaxID=674703 RepID=UPI00078DCCCD|nr:ABC transporter permease [Rhodoplanes sp. Z2-YC6860]AMN43981.1 ABC transporter permease [Rhodoplanes sp. Z2-YC6860]